MRLCGIRYVCHFARNREYEGKREGGDGTEPKRGGDTMKRVDVRQLVAG